MRNAKCKMQNNPLIKHKIPNLIRQQQPQYTHRRLVWGYKRDRHRGGGLFACYLAVGQVACKQTPKFIWGFGGFLGVRVGALIWASPYKRAPPRYPSETGNAHPPKTPKTPKPKTKPF